jgi:hypothetical protein
MADARDRTMIVGHSCSSSDSSKIHAERSSERGISGDLADRGGIAGLTVVGPPAVHPS